MSSEPGAALFFLVFLVVELVLVLVGIYTLTPLRPLGTKGQVWLLYRNVKRNRRSLLILLLTLVAYFSLSLSEEYYVGRIGIDLTPSIFALEGATPITTLQSLESPLLTAIMVLVYIFGFGFIIALPPTLFAWTGQDRELRLLSHSVLWMHVVALPIFLLLHVTVTSIYSPEVRQLLYSNGVLMDFAGTGGFHNAFPSSHVYMTTMAFLSSLRIKGEYTLFPLVAGAILALTIFSTVYLGVHWLSDVVGGLLLSICVFSLISSRTYWSAIDQSSFSP